jgi:hypothetical protein
MASRLRIEEVLEYLGIEDPELLRALRREGLFGEDLVGAREAEELRVAACLMRDLGVNPAGVDVVLHLRRRLLALQGLVTDSMERLLEELDSR